MFRKILPICALLALLLCAPAAAQQEDYVPGRDTAAYFLDALTNGEIISLHVKPSIPAYYESLAPDEASRANIRSGLHVLNNTTLSIGTGLPGDSLRLELDVLGEGKSDASAGAAVNISRKDLTIESSLIPGECAVISWAELLTLLGADEASAQTAIAMLEQDPQLLAEQLAATIEPAAELAVQALTPYGEIIAEFFTSLPVLYKNVSGSDQFPTLAKEFSVIISQKDLGTLLTQLTDHLEQDALGGMLLTSLLSQQTEIPVSSSAELCALLRQAAAALTDTEPLITLFTGEDASGNPLFATLQLSVDGESASLEMKTDADEASGSESCHFSLFFTNAQGERTTLILLSTTSIPGAFSGFEIYVGDYYLAAASRKESTQDESGQLTLNTKYNLTLCDQASPMIDFGFSTEALPQSDGETIRNIFSISGAAISDPFLCASEFVFTPGADDADGSGTITLVTDTGADGALNFFVELHTTPYRMEAARPLTVTKISIPEDEATLALLERAAAGLEAFKVSLQNAFPTSLPNLGSAAN